MLHQIADAVNEKVFKGKQLACVPDSQSTVVALALGFNVMPDLAPILVAEWMHGKRLPSAVQLWGGFMCKEAPSLIENPSACSLLNEHEVRFFHRVGKVGALPS